MSLDRIISPNAATEDEERLQTALRPRTLDEFIGQDLQRRRLSIALEAARQRREPLDHLLLSGLPGQPFTLVGATTRKGLLSSPLRERFGLNFELDFYAVADLTLIVRRSAGLLGVHLDVEAAEEIAGRARGTPRIANRLLRRVRDFAQVYQIEHVGVE